MPQSGARLVEGQGQRGERTVVALLLGATVALQLPARRSVKENVRKIVENNGFRDLQKLVLALELGRLKRLGRAEDAIADPV